MIDNNFQYFDIETTVNEDRNIRGIILKNGIRIVLISDPNINMSSCSVAVGAGYWQDEFQGTAHFLEHLLFMGNEKYKEQNEYHSYIQICGGYDNAYTSDNVTCYFLSLETSFLKKGIEMLSWFFRAPLLDAKHINSEMDIIDSEHKKNILQDMWIIDNIFKNFIKDGKYINFGTGNKISLQGIKKEDIMNYYNKYYTTDNIYVCIVDSKPIDKIISEYVNFFSEIPKKIYKDKENKESKDRFEKEELNLINNNMILFNLNSEYKYFNYILIINCDQTNQEDYQLTHLISFLIGLEYEDSLCYYLKENDYIKYMNCNLDYFYDKQAEINISCVLNGNSKNYMDYKIKVIYILIDSYIKNLAELSKSEFEKIYLNFYKVKMIESLYSSKNDPVDITNEVVDNMIKGDLNLCILRKNYVPEYNAKLYKKFIEKITQIKIKIMTNVIKDKSINFIKSKWYDSTFYITDFNIKNNYKNDIFDVKKSIGIKNFIIRTESHLKKVNKNKIPKLVYQSKEFSRNIYLLDVNKYGKPMSNITVMRKNIKSMDKYNKVIINIFIELCTKILNYYLESMGQYKMKFIMYLSDEYIIYNFYGLDYVINNFLSVIISKIHPDNIFFNKKSEIYFMEIIRDIKEIIVNLKYNSPYSICTNFFNIILNNILTPEEKLKFLSKLTFEKFKIMIIELLKYSDEYFLFIGNFDSNLDYIVEHLSLNPKKYLDKKLEEKFSLIDERNFETYIISKKDFNPKEINNCLIISHIFYQKTVEFANNKMSIQNIREFIKNKLICGFIADILNEPLFDRIRTIDKLGYIVKCDKKIVFNSNKIIIGIIYLIQSSYSIKRIKSSIKLFNKFIREDIKVNNDIYLEKFNTLKKSRLLELQKPFSELVDEVISYISVILSKIYIFNIKKITFEICKSINFSVDIVKYIMLITNNNTQSFDIILDKDK